MTIHSPKAEAGTKQGEFVADSQKNAPLEQNAPYFVLRVHILRLLRTKNLDFVPRGYFLRDLRTK